ncbi:DUF5682 family protein [Delftia sp. DT-2]|uniref:DUF5682 family protein n=1 Tax=Delftia sp. DT-2 TaxID=3022772 RepID=UPI00233EA8E3|nr:DUF5682 family protein [Delftia sp. DT-2]MDC2860727.1 DUF5682 family protein [Delftia sp. DT-2]
MSTDAAAWLAPLPQLRLVPVRHHSPRCAHHLRALMREFKPSHVLIEGPGELDALLPALQHAQARPPLAAYLQATVAGGDGAHETNGANGALEDDWRCRCYVPFAAFSPEWVALREAVRLRSHVRFIDLPYAARLVQAAQLDYFACAPEPLLADEPSRRAPDVLAGLIQAGGCRDFDEWWDRHYESGNEDASPQAYFAGVLAFSQLLRERDEAAGGAGPDAEDRAREAHMAAQVRKALAEGGRCLVVCGGFHVAGIVAGITAGLSAPERPAAAGQPIDVGVHLIPYTLQRLERASGYAAGMPMPGYYQGVWQALEQGASQPDAQAWPEMAARTVNGLRARGLPASLPDAAEAVRLAHGLAALRACHGGRAELLEALDSAVFKEHAQALRPQPMEPQAGQQTGQQIGQWLLDADDYGQLPPNAPAAPLLVDVQAFCLRHRLPVRPAAPVRKELDIYRSARHRRLSQGLHRLRYLGVPYAQCLAGPDFVAGTGLARVREVWTLGWQVETTVALTEAMRHGSSLQEAAVHRVLERLSQTADTEPAQRVLEVLVMGLDGIAQQVLDTVQAWMERSHDALALARATGCLALAYEARHALGGVGLARLLPLLRRCFAQACLRLPWLGEGDASQQAQALDALADLHGMVCRAVPWADAGLFHDACAALHEAGADSTPARVRGATAGILSMAGRWQIAQTDAALRAMLGLAQVDAAAMGEYLQGFVRVAKGWLLSHPPLLRLLSDGIAHWPQDAFLAGLPALRLAFAQLTRAELRQLAGRLAGLSGAATPPGATTLACVHLPSDEALAHSRALAAQVGRLLHPWGLS